MASGGGSVGRVVASDTKDLRFESQHWQNFYLPMVHLKRKDENKEK